MASKIFISYRRRDSAAAAGRLYDFLESKVGSKALFKDVDTLPFGRSFRSEIQRAIDDSRIVLVIIGRHFIAEENRLFNEDDYVRYEIAYALEKGKTIIPIRVDDAQMPRPIDLPAEIQKLSTIHGPELRHVRWKGDCQDFWEKIEPLFMNTVPQSSSVKKNSGSPTNQFSDPRDGQVYRTVELIGKTWMVQNLNFDVGQGCWIYKEKKGFLNLGRKVFANHGRLYTWEAAMKACPPGWRLPTIMEYHDLINHFGGDRRAFRPLTKGWGYGGLNLTLSGAYYTDGGFPYRGIKSSGYYWSSTQYDDEMSSCLGILSGVQRCFFYQVKKTNGSSCRCIKE